LQKIVLSGSARTDGKTGFIITKLFPDHKIVKILDLNIEPCTNCNKCDKGNCILNDDFEYTIESMNGTFVLVSPIFFGGFPSYVKAFIDRFQYYWISQKKLNFDFSAIILHGEQVNRVFERVLEFTSKLIFNLLNADKTFFHIFHKFTFEDLETVEKELLWVKEKIETVYSVK